MAATAALKWNIYNEAVRSRCIKNVVIIEIVPMKNSITLDTAYIYMSVCVCVSVCVHTHCYCALEQLCLCAQNLYENRTHLAMLICAGIVCCCFRFFFLIAFQRCTHFLKLDVFYVFRYCYCFCCHIFFSIDVGSWIKQQWYYD